MAVKYYCDRCKHEMTGDTGRLRGMIDGLAFEVTTGLLGENGNVNWNGGVFCLACVRWAVAGIQPQLSCLLCGQAGEKAIVHEPSGVFVCLTCRECVQKAGTPEPGGDHAR